MSYIADLQAAAGPDEFLAVVDQYRDGIPVRDKVDGRWRTVSIGELDRVAPDRAAFWRGRFVGRWEAAARNGWSWFPHWIDPEASADDDQGGGEP